MPTRSACKIGRRASSATAGCGGAPVMAKSTDVRMRLLRQQVEVGFGDAAVGAHPVVGNVFKARAGRDAVFWPPGRLVVQQATGPAHPKSGHAAYSFS